MKKSINRKWMDNTLHSMREHARLAREGNDPVYHERHLRWDFEQMDAYLSGGMELPTEWDGERNK